MLCLIFWYHFYGVILGLSHVRQVKSEEKKPAHFLSFIAHQISILAVKWIKQSQNKMFKALIWGIVHFCRSNITRDMIKILKSCFFKKQFFTFNFSKKCKNWHFLKKQFFSFLIISPVIFDLQKCTIPHIKALTIQFWPYFIHFIARMGIWWAMKPRKCPVFFSPDFTFIWNRCLASLWREMRSLWQGKIHL